jgi:uncharacterized protein YaiI (UPF0178 family)
MFERHLAKQQRKAGGRIGTMKKRSKDDDERFEKSFTALCSKLCNV